MRCSWISQYAWYETYTIASSFAVCLYNAHALTVPSLENEHHQDESDFAHEYCKDVPHDRLVLVHFA